MQYVSMSLLSMSSLAVFSFSFTPILYIGESMLSRENPDFFHVFSPPMSARLHRPPAHVGEADAIPMPLGRNPSLPF